MKVIFPRFKITPPTSLPKTKSQPNWVSLGSVTDIITGTFSKEEMKKVDKKTQSYLSAKLNLEELKKTLLEVYMKTLNKLPFENKKDAKNGITLYNYEPAKISNQLISSIKNQIIELFALNQAINKDHPEYLNIPYSQWFDTNLGVQNSMLLNQVFTHPNTKIAYLISYFSKDDLGFMQEIGRKYIDEPSDKIFKEKTKLLSEMMKYTKNPKTDFIGELKDKEIKHLKRIYLKSLVLTDLSKLKDIDTYSLESVLCSYPINSNLKIGEFIPNLGLIINKIALKTQNGETKPVIITYSSQNKDCCLNMYDIDYISNLRKKIQDKYNSGNFSLQELEAEAKKAIELEKNAKISSIKFNIIDRNYLIALLNRNKILDTKRDDIFEITKNKPAYLISNFINRDTKKYPKAGIIIGIELLKILAKKNCAPIFLNALAYGENKKRSPIRLYERIGFKPISHSMEEINELAEKNKGNFPIDVSVMFMMNNLEPLKTRLVELEKIYNMKSI